RGRSAALFHRTFVQSTAGMRINLVRRTKLDVDHSAIGSPSRLARCEVLVGIRDAAIVLFFVFVLYRVRSRVAAKPELLNELVALLVVGELLERLALFVGDNPPHVLVLPLLVRSAQLRLHRLLLFFSLLVAERTLERIDFLLALVGSCFTVVG